MVSIKTKEKCHLSTVPLYTSNTFQYSHLLMQPTPCLIITLKKYEYEY